MKSEPTFWARIYASGPLDVIKHECRRFCQQGLCVTVDPTVFIYTGGEEHGAVIGLVNYPRFPSTPEEIVRLATTLANDILSATFQRSIMVVTPDKTWWLTRDIETLNITAA